ncbi:glucokinase regulator family protein [Purpureocillium lilacinum]|uniref:N-acetyl-D-glucosamine kinase n=1 Tax=Purpureocillium lilacinum TaxID=33203 RepID=A0A2U3EDC4_PURLI|nr:glucokinase regulator family protein [Purpureocillium lilacinum]
MDATIGKPPREHLHTITTPAMAPSPDPHQSEHALSSLQTEALSPVARTMDSMDTLDLCTSFNREEARVACAIAACLPAIAAFVDDLVPRLRAGGRLVYVGAGNSGRVAHMDCAELPVTFSVDREQFLAVVAGGTGAVLEAVEGAEDLFDDGATKMNDLCLTSQDTVIGISASGRTPFAMGALEVAMRCGSLTAVITNTRPSRMEDMGVAHPISVPVGPEFVTGSTRLKAGSCAKQVLNMISTCAMVNLGKTHGGLMVDVRANNEKLHARGRRIVRQVCAGKPLMRTISQHVLPNAEADEDAGIDALIERCGGSVKLACAVGLSGLHPDVAKRRLDAVDGHLQAFATGLGPELQSLAGRTGTDREKAEKDDDYFLCVDGGGTKCAVSIATRIGTVARATAGPCNLNSAPLDDIVEQIRCATAAAVASIHPSNDPSRPWPRFTKVWAGIAGLHHTSQAELLSSRLEQLLGVSAKEGSLRLTCDTSLLSACLGADELAEGCIALVAGTGAVATAFRRSDSGDDAVQVGRTGGWGHLVGDQGSAFYIGQQALRTVLASLEGRQSETQPRSLNRLEAAIVKHLDCDPRDVLSNILVPGVELPKQRIGRISKVVTELGFADVDPDPQPLAILHDAASCLARIVKPLASQKMCDPAKSILALSGALMNVKPYRELVLDKCAAMGVSFRRTVLVDDASAYGAEFLSKTAPTPLDEDMGGLLASRQVERDTIIGDQLSHSCNVDLPGIRPGLHKLSVA